MKKIIFLLSYACILFFAASCANVQAPSGGPKDTVAPVILIKEPADNTLRFTEKTISLAFSKHMNRQSVIENISVAPAVRTEYDWSGKELNVTFPDGLAENTTYSVTLGTEYSDLKGNKPAMAYTMVFSTGDHLDSGAVSGKAVGQNAAGKYIWLYKIDNMNPDTLYIPRNRPAYSVQLGSSGEFTVKALKDGNYRVLCVDDKFKDGILDEMTDNYSCATGDVRVYNGISEKIFIRVPLPEDKAGPLLNSAFPLDSRRFTVNFSEPLSRGPLLPGAVTVEDTTGKTLSVYSVDPAKEKTAVIVTVSENLSASMKYKIGFAENAVKDTAGFALKESSVYAFGSDDTDSSAPAIVYISVKDSSYDISPDITDSNRAGLFFRTSVPAGTPPLSVARLFRDSLETPVRIIASGKTEFAIVTDSLLAEEAFYRLAVDLAEFKWYDGRTGAGVSEIRFRTGRIPAFSSVSGEIAGDDGCAGNVMIEAYNSAEKKKYVIKAEGGKWSMPKATAGTYSFFLYCDANGNGRYDKGGLAPFAFAEKFSVRENQLAVKQRWDFEKVILYFE